MNTKFVGKYVKEPVKLDDFSLECREFECVNIEQESNGVFLLVGDGQCDGHSVFMSLEQLTQMRDWMNECINHNTLSQE